MWISRLNYVNVVDYYKWKNLEPSTSAASITWWKPAGSSWGFPAFLGPTAGGSRRAQGSGADVTHSWESNLPVLKAGSSAGTLGWFLWMSKMAAREPTQRYRNVFRPPRRPHPCWGGTQFWWKKKRQLVCGNVLFVSNLQIGLRASTLNRNKISSRKPKRVRCCLKTHVITANEPPLAAIGVSPEQKSLSGPTKPNRTATLQLYKCIKRKQVTQKSRKKNMYKWINGLHVPLHSVAFCTFGISEFAKRWLPRPDQWIDLEQQGCVDWSAELYGQSHRFQLYDSFY